MENHARCRVQVSTGAFNDRGVYSIHSHIKSWQYLSSIGINPFSKSLTKDVFIVFRFVSVPVFNTTLPTHFITYHLHHDHYRQHRNRLSTRRRSSKSTHQQSKIPAHHHINHNITSPLITRSILYYPTDIQVPYLTSIPVPRLPHPSPLPHHLLHVHHSAQRPRPSPENRRHLRQHGQNGRHHPRQYTQSV
jgi:hypothetical protein